MKLFSRADGRLSGELRTLDISTGFHRWAEGSVLYACGQTRVLATVSVQPGVPDWMKGRGKGWLTAEYQMHPRANPDKRESRDGRGKNLSGRTQEIQRLIGRSLRAAVDLGRIGEQTMQIDCDVLEADGGTRTASVTAAFIAVALAAHKLGWVGDKAALREQIAAVSVGKLSQGLAVDLDYREDSAAHVDMNVVATANGGLVEVQATAEGETLTRAEHDALLNHALGAIQVLHLEQQAVLAQAKIDLKQLLVASPS